MKTCNRCLRELPITAFYAMRSAKDGRQSCCIECRRAYNRENAAHIRKRHRDYLVRTGRMSGDGRATIPRGDAPDPARLRKYGLTPGEFEALLIAQGGRCAICFDAHAEPSRMSIDHDHETGAVRGLLCSRCNLALGIMLDNPVRLRSAAVYLEASDAWMALRAIGCGR